MNTSQKRIFVLLLLANLHGLPVRADTTEALEKAVFEAEAGFAKSMADRDFDAFSDYIAEDAVFLSDRILRGKQAVLAEWQNFFDDGDAPFSWQPETVAVVGSGDIGLSSGPVRNSAGKIFAFFHSTWRREANGQWKIVLEKGHPYCTQQAPSPPDS